MAVVRRLFVFLLCASCAAYLTYLAAGAQIEASVHEANETVFIRDSISPNRHVMSGVVMVQSTCSELSITAQQISPIAYKLAFATWEEPNVPCDRTPTPRSFHTIVFAPAVGVVFIGTMDDRAIPLVVTPVIERS